MAPKKRPADRHDDDSEPASKRGSGAAAGAASGTGAGASAVASSKHSDALTCPACLELFEYPVDLGCGHTMCEHCLKEWLGGSQKGKVCPTCNRTVQTGNVKNIALEAIIDGMIESMPQEEKQSELDRRLGLAAVHARPGRMAALLQMGANMNTHHSTVLKLATCIGTPLWIYAAHGTPDHAECAKLLLLKGASIHPVTLFNACVHVRSGWRGVIVMMLDKGARPTFVNPDGKNITCLALMLAHGVDAGLALRVIELGCPVKGRVEGRFTLLAAGGTPAVTVTNATVADMAAVRGWHRVFTAIIAGGGVVTSMTPAVKECIAAQWLEDHPDGIWKEQAGQGAGSGAGGGSAS